MDTPADLLQPDGFPRPGLYDCQPAPAPGVDLGCLYFYWNGVRYSARPIGNLAALRQAEAASTIAVKALALQQQQKAAAGTCFAGTPVPGQVSSARSPLELADRSGYLRGFAAAKALLLAVEPPKLSEDLSGMNAGDASRAGQLQGQEGPAEAQPKAGSVNWIAKWLQQCDQLREAEARAHKYELAYLSAVSKIEDFARGFGDV